MIIIDNLHDNEEIKQIILKYDLETPKFWINDKVSIKPNIKELASHYDIFKWNFVYETFFEKSNKLKVILMFKYDKNDPYWYLLKNEYGDELYFLEDFLMNNTPSYIPKKLIIEFFEFINIKY
jgi:hypothetical protein